MRGVWENEKPLSPALLRSAMTMVGAFLALSSAVMLIIAAGAASNGNYVPAAAVLASGIMGCQRLADKGTNLNTTSNSASDSTTSSSSSGATSTTPSSTTTTPPSTNNQSTTNQTPPPAKP